MTTADLDVNTVNTYRVNVKCGPIGNTLSGGSGGGGVLYSPVNFLIDHKVVFDGHAAMSDNFTAESIDGQNMRHAKHDQFLVLVHM